MKTKKILFALPTFSVGGLEKQLLGQLKYYGLNKSKITLATLFSIDDRPDYFDQLPPDINIHKFNFKFGRFFLNSTEVFEVIKFLKKENFDLIVTSMTPANFLFSALKPFFKYKLITREHNIYTDKKVYHRILDQIFSYFADAIVAVSEEVADFFSNTSHVNRNKIIVIHNGIDLELISKYGKKSEDKEEIKRRLGFEDKDKIILNVARLKKQKNHEFLIKVFSQFVKKLPEHKLVILGDGQERGNLEKLIRDLGLKDKVLLLGFRTDVYDFYSISDFFALPSIREGFPNVVLEALAFGLPVISAPVPGIRAVINENNGYIVELNENKWVEKMEKINSRISENRTKINEICSDSVRNFDIKKTVDQYETLFNKILNSNEVL